MNLYNTGQIAECKTLQSVRDRYDIFSLFQKVKTKGDWNRLSKELNINGGVLCRAIEEAKLIYDYPIISNYGSKVTPLSRLKTNKERRLFFEKYDITKLGCRELYTLVKEWRVLLEKNPRFLLTDEQQDLIIGSTLGDANIRQRDKNCSFRVAHSKKQEEYLILKYNLLKEFTINVPYWSRRKINNHFVETLELSTFTHQVFNFYYGLFYKNGKKTITRELLDMLTPRSIAFWICDDGSFDNKQCYIVLCTNSFSFDEHKIIKGYFENVWNLSPTIGFRDKKYYFLRFKQRDTEKLIQIVKPFIPNCMKYKINKKNG